MHHCKPKDPEIKDYTLCLDNISKGLTINNMKKKKKIIFSVDFNPVNNNDILHIPKYFVKKSIISNNTWYY